MAKNRNAVSVNGKRAHPRGQAPLIHGKRVACLALGLTHGASKRTGASGSRSCMHGSCRIGASKGTGFSDSSRSYGHEMSLPCPMNRRCLSPSMRLSGITAACNRKVQPPKWLDPSLMRYTAFRLLLITIIPTPASAVSMVPRR